VQDPWQADSARPLARWSPHYWVRRLLPNQEDATAQETTVQGASASDLAAALVVGLQDERLPRVF